MESTSRDVVDFHFSIAVEDLSGAWKLVQEAVQSRARIGNVALRNKFGNQVTVDSVGVEYLLASDQRLAQLRRHSHSPVTWFRHPYVVLITVSTDDVDFYRKTLKPRIKSIIDTYAAQPGSFTDYVVLYVRPVTTDQAAKGPRRVFDALRHDFGRQRDRCVRIDVHARRGSGTGAGPGVLGGGMEELERQVREAVRVTFEARGQAYEDELRKLMASRKAADWNFSTLFLVKDSLAVMLEAAGLLEDALREYTELEAAYLETLEQQGSIAAGTAPTSDNAILLSATWQDVRHSIMQHGSVDELHFRQYFFARQASLLLRLGRPADVVDLGLQFVRGFGVLLDAKQAASVLPEGFRAAWTFSACVELASAVSAALQQQEDGGVDEGDDSSSSGGRGGGREEEEEDDDEAVSTSTTSRLTRTQSAEELSPTRSTGVHANGVVLGRVPSSVQLQSSSLSPRDAAGGAATTSASVTTASAMQNDPTDWRLGPPPERSVVPEHRQLYTLLGLLYATARTSLCEVANVKHVVGDASPRLQLYAVNAARSMGELGRRPSRPSTAPSSPAHATTPQPVTHARGRSVTDVALHDDTPLAAQQNNSTPAATQGSLWKRPPTPSRSRLGQMLGAANDAAHLAAAAPAPAVDSPTTDAQPPASTNHVDIRAIEQHVATINIAAPRPAAPVSQGEEEPPSPSAARAPWLQQWRLRVALSSPHALLELFVELSLLAGRCFAGAGRGRTAAALRCDVADVLAREGRHAAAAALYEQLVSLVGCWRVLARHTLQRLLRCQQALKSPAVVRTIVQLLELAVQEGAPKHAPTVDTLLQQLYDAAARAPDVVQCGGLFEAAVPQRSILYGGIGQDGRAMLHSGATTGCVCACVGDIVDLTVHVHNRLGSSVVVDAGWTLTMGVMLQARGQNTWEEHDEVTITAAAASTSVPAGHSTAAFVFPVTRTGLYTPKHIVTMVGRVRVCVPMTTHSSLVLGSVDAQGMVQSLQVVLEVLPAQPRVQLVARLPLGGALLAGCAQWWGVVIEQLHDGGMRDVHMRVGLPDAHMVLGDGKELEVVSSTLPGTSVVVPDDVCCGDGSHPCVWVWTDAPPIAAPSTETVRVGTLGNSTTSSTIVRSSSKGTDVDVALQYTAGCRRSHTSTLTLPITQPWAVRCTATKLQQHGVLLTAALQPVADVMVLGVRMVPQPGYSVRRCLFGGRAALVRQHGRLQVVVEMVRQQGALACEDDAGVLEVDWQWVCGKGVPDAVGGPAVATFQHHIQLEWFTAPASGAADDVLPNAVAVRLLGPYEAEVGRPVLLLWQVMLGEGTDAVDVVYDVHADGTEWQPCGRRSGSVTVGAGGATIEAAFVPTCEGVLQQPELRVRNAPVVHRVDAVGVRVHGGGAFGVAEGDAW